MRKGVAKERAKKGTIPSKNFQNDRARQIHRLLTKFGYRMDDDVVEKINKKCTEILEIGESENLFSGKDPHITAVEIFVAVNRNFTWNNKPPATQKEIKDLVGQI